NPDPQDNGADSSEVENSATDSNDDNPEQNEDGTTSDADKAPKNCRIEPEAQTAELKQLGMQAVTCDVKQTYFPHQDFTAENPKLFIFNDDGAINLLSIGAACAETTPPATPGNPAPPTLSETNADLPPITGAPDDNLPAPASHLNPDLTEAEGTETNTEADIETIDIPETEEIENTDVTLELCTSDLSTLARIFDGDGDGVRNQDTVAVLELAAIAPAGADRYPIYRHSPIPDRFTPTLFSPELLESAAGDERGQDFFRVGYGLPGDLAAIGFSSLPTKQLGANRYDVYEEELVAARFAVEDALKRLENAENNPPPEGLPSLLGEETVALIQTVRVSCPIPVTVAPSVADRRSFKTLAYDVDDGSRSGDIFGLAFCLYDGGISGYALNPRWEIRIPEAGFRRGEEGSPAFIDGKIAGVASREIDFPAPEAEEGEGEGESAAENVGEAFADVRVSAYADFIDAVLQLESEQPLPDQR
ncbi:MAG: hypothetical protein ACPGVO_21955, partial [Spirulinaceae cyanobacterium]